jgi:hypothetical protein
VNAVLREITKLWAIRDRLVVRSSVIPSAKYCWSGSLLRFANGSTTMDNRGATMGFETGGTTDVTVVEAGQRIGIGQTRHATAAKTMIAAAVAAIAVTGGRLRRSAGDRACETSGAAIASGRSE